MDGEPLTGLMMTKFNNTYMCHAASRDQVPVIGKSISLCEM